MTTRRAHVRLQDIVGKKVRDSDGKVAGRVAEVEAEVRGKECHVTGYRLGTAALLSRLGISSRRLTGLQGAHELLRVDWRDLDISDPGNLRLRISVEQLEQQQTSGSSNVPAPKNRARTR